MIRKIMAVLAAVVVAVTVFLIAERVNHAIHPFPQTPAEADKAAWDIQMKQMPYSFWFTVLISWALGSLLAGLTVRLISRSQSRTLPLMVGVLLTGAAVANIFAFWQPLWFTICGLLLFIPMVMAGFNLIKLKTATT